MPTLATPPGELTAKQAKAILCLLHEPTLEKAAAKAAIHETTLIRWMKEETFGGAFREAKRAVVDLGVASLGAGCAVAVATLLEVAGDSLAPASSRVSAARAILDLSLRAVEIDGNTARIEALETVLKERNEKH